MAFSIIRVPGQNNLVSDTTDDTLDLVPGPGIAITTNALIDTITISATSTTGFTGSVGAAGIIGFTGSVGATGAAGSAGDIGYTGSVGAIGATGFTGSMGLSGLQGTQGNIGFTGSTGTNGATGFTGSMGLSGLQGIQGIIGFSGSVGASGPTGFTGSRGATGFFGSSGSIGFSGSMGITGFVGSRGPQGNAGYTGSIGFGYRTFRVPGQSSLVADQLEDILDIVAGTGISITTNAAIDAITISATGVGGGTGYTGSRGVAGAAGYHGSTGYAGSGALSYRTIRVLGQGSLIADQNEDVLDLVAGPGISITTNPSIDAITITATGGGGGGGGGMGYAGSAGYTGSKGDTGFTGSHGDIGFTGSASTEVGFTGSQGDIGYTGSSGSTNTALIVACSDESTPLTVGVAKTTFRMPYAFNLTAIRASLTSAQATGNVFTVDVNVTGIGSILTTKLTIDNGDKTSTTASVAPVFVTTPYSLSDDSEITIDIDQVGDGTAAGLKVTLIGGLQ